MLIQPIQKYFNISLEEFYNATVDGVWAKTMPYYKWQRPYKVISMQEFELYVDIARSMIEEYLGETIELSEKTINIITKQEPIYLSQVKGMRFVTNSNSLLYFGRNVTTYFSSSGVIRQFVNNNKYKDKFFAMFDTKSNNKKQKVFTLYNGKRNVSIENFSQTGSQHMFSGSSIELIKENILEDKSFSLQTPHNLSDDSIFETELGLKVETLDDTVHGELITKEGRYDILVSNESPGIAKINDIVFDKDICIIPNEISLSHVSSIFTATKLTENDIQSAWAMLFGSIVPLELVKNFDSLYDTCKKLQVDNTTSNWINIKVTNNYMYNPFGQLYGQIKAYEILEKIKNNKQ